MRILVDMNLSPSWVPVLRANGFEAEHWSTVGDPRAADRQIMEWARAREYVVFTHDLDFGTLLAASGQDRPSVLQVRTQDVLPGTIGKLACAALNQFSKELSAGAIVVVDLHRNRVRLLPLQ